MVVLIASHLPSRYLCEEIAVKRPAMRALGGRGLIFHSADTHRPSGVRMSSPTSLTLRRKALANG